MEPVLGQRGPARNQNLQQQTEESSNANDDLNANSDLQESIAKLAHALWQDRGCPMGSAEQDWSEAEEKLTSTQRQTATAGR